MLAYDELEPRYTFLQNYIQNLNIFFRENAFENAVCKISAHFVHIPMC